MQRPGEAPKVATTMAEEPRGKFMYDIVVARLAAQSADQAALVSRAKDLLGVAAISSTITGVVANDKLINVTRSGLDPAAFVIMSVALVVVIICAFVCMRPREWFLSPGPGVAVKFVKDHKDWPVDAYYAAIARGFVNPDSVVVGMSALEHNDEQISALRNAVVVEMFALGTLALCGVLLAGNAVI